MSNGVKSLLKKIIPSFIFSLYHFLLAFLGALIYGFPSLAFLGALIYGFPSRELIVIAVTGTNGKSTVVYLTTEVLEKAGFKTASLSSIKFKIGKKEWPNLLKMTMPGRFKLQKFLRQAVKAGLSFRNF